MLINEVALLYLDTYTLCIIKSLLLFSQYTHQTVKPAFLNLTSQLKILLKNNLETVIVEFRQAEVFQILSWLIWAEIESKAHADLPKRPINQLKPVQQSIQHALRAYCPNNCTVPLRHDVLSSNLFSAFVLLGAYLLLAAARSAGKVRQIT